MNYREYIGNLLTGFPDSKLRKKGTDILAAQMESRENELFSRGLTDKKVVEDLLRDEFSDPAAMYTQLLKTSPSLKSTSRRIMGTVLASALYVLVLTAVYLGFSFASQAWAQSWLIMVSGIIIGADILLMRGVSRGITLHRYKIARALVAAATMLTVTLLFLLILMLTELHMSYIIFIIGAAAMILADTLLAGATGQKFAILNTLICIPSVTALVYVSLALLKLIAWHPGWLLMLASVILDAAIIAAAVIRRDREDREEEKAWSAD